ncbi:MAG: ChaN family lipoprotein, partial [Proteobacteria bacterium]|nr:ChaN family lipoprotein [Pseudomonadota bacterium]
MKRIFQIFLSVIVFLGAQNAIQAHLTHRIYDLENNKEMLMSEAISDLKKNRIILVGESHTNQNHHFAQLNVIQSLNEAGVQVAIGLEMFRNDSQQALDH